MPNHHDWERADLEQEEIARLMLELGEWQTKIAEAREELIRTKADAAKVVHALNCSTQLIEALLAWLPEGLVLSPDVSTAKGAWTEAMKGIMR